MKAQLLEITVAGGNGYKQRIKTRIFLKCSNKTMFSIADRSISTSYHLAAINRIVY